MAIATYQSGLWAQTNTTNAITLARALLAFPLIYFAFHDMRWWALGVVILAAASDGLDGYLARRWGQCTPLGREGDPLADKFLTDFALLSAAWIHHYEPLLLLFFLTVGYDLYNTYRRRHGIARAVLNLKDDEADLKVTNLSKFKTAALFVLVGYCFFPDALIAPEVLKLLTLGCIVAVIASWLNNYINQ